jgi:hypothetical protein
LLLTVLIVVSINPFAEAQILGISLSLKTDEPSYYINYAGKYVYIYGNLTQDGTLVQDGLVALEVVDASNILATRTVATNVTTTDNWLMNLTQFVPCNEVGSPTNSFSAGGLSYFDVSVRSNDNESCQVLLAVTAYDEGLAPLGVSSIEFILQAYSSLSVIMSLSIPSYQSQTYSGAENGTATAYADAFSAWPSYGGKAYCPERSSTFKITNGVTRRIFPPQNETEGNYEMTFRLSSGQVLGTYSVYATSMYQNGTAFRSTQFVVRVQGDANGDGVVDAQDFFILEHAWGTSIGQPGYDPRADFNNDGVIDAQDLFILEQNWGYGT